MTEQWKSIEGFEGLYEVSNLGRVRSLDHYTLYSNGRKCFHEGKILSQNIHDGYKRVSLTKDGKRISKSTHRLVAEAFISNPESKPEVDHIDTDRTNNRVDNLHWVTSKENMNNPITRERTLKNVNARLYDMNQKRKAKVLCVTTGKEFDSVKEAADYYGCERGNITKVCKGKQKTCGSLPDGTRLKWKYVD